MNKKLNTKVVASYKVTQNCLFYFTQYDELTEMRLVMKMKWKKTMSILLWNTVWEYFSYTKPQLLCFSIDVNSNIKAGFFTLPFCQPFGSWLELYQVTIWLYTFADMAEKFFWQMLKNPVILPFLVASIYIIVKHYEQGSLLETSIISSLLL